MKGLADLDIYTNCNIQSQFSNQSHSRYAPASAALTIDEKLARALRKSNSHSITSGEIICGPENENENDNKAKMEAFIEEYKRMRESEQRYRIAIESRKYFMKELISIVFFSESTKVCSVYISGQPLYGHFCAVCNTRRIYTFPH
ncbi:hypothetical protein AB2F35_25485 (plasmid) [Escherichia coli]|uniref:hypothetical protein n=1 Tax=Escherichia coli TaxID=562 RepID=UPI0015EF924D|nr:hypothetical protein [Escherichia coli]MBB0222965.1 hypothetical protein [Escherichia coli]HBK2374254.1 hypothetical protein [Escherichia coli]HBK2707927.1 hypothetical protein [Escherichia coli]